MSQSISGMQQVWMSNANSYTAISMNVSTLGYGSNTSSKLLSMIVDGVTKFSVDANGNVVATGNTAIGTTPVSTSRLTVGGSGGSISVTGSDASFGAGGNRAFIDYDGHARFGTASGGGSATSGVQIVADNVIGIAVDVSGRVTTPYQPYARVSKNNGNIVNNNTIIFNFADDDSYGMYNGTTGRFTAPVTGRYMFTHGMFTNAGNQAWLKWRVNGTAIATTYSAVTTSYNSVAGCIILKMNANDWADLWVDSGATYSVYGGDRTQCWAVFSLIG